MSRYLRESELTAFKIANQASPDRRESEKAAASFTIKTLTGLQ